MPCFIRYSITSLFFYLAVSTILLPEKISGQNDLEVMNFRNYTIAYNKGDLENVRWIRERLQKFSLELDAFYQLKPKSNVRVIIARSQQAFIRYHRQIPHWAAAVYLPARKMIVLKSPSWAGSSLSLEKDLLHELSHFYFDEKFASQQLPLWYNEGLAKFLSGERIDILTAVRLSNAFHTGGIVPFDDVEDLSNFPRQQAELAYQQSLSAVLFLREQLQDTERWQRFHQKVAAVGWEAALQDYINTDAFGLELDWLNSIENDYRWLFLFNTENLVWFSMVVIFIAAFAVTKLRNRRKLKQWEQFEQDLNELE